LKKGGLYFRNFYSQHAAVPIATLGPYEKPAIVIKCHPSLFRPFEDTLDTRVSSAFLSLPYRVIFAVATQDTVWIYDTYQLSPVACIKDMHCATITDLAWYLNTILFRCGGADLHFIF
jgi:chromatin assembly factor 1 subunit B